MPTRSSAIVAFPICAREITNTICRQTCPGADSLSASLMREHAMRQIKGSKIAAVAVI
jgi:hypothetical protein